MGIRWRRNGLFDYISLTRYDPSARGSKGGRNREQVGPFPVVVVDSRDTNVRSKETGQIATVRGRIRFQAASCGTVASS